MKNLFVLFFFFSLFSCNKNLEKIFPPSTNMIFTDSCFVLNMDLKTNKVDTIYRSKDESINMIKYDSQIIIFDYNYLKYENSVDKYSDSTKYYSYEELLKMYKYPNFEKYYHDKKSHQCYLFDFYNKNITPFVIEEYEFDDTDSSTNFIKTTINNTKYYYFNYNFRHGPTSHSDNWRFYSETKVINNKKVFSFKGDLILQEFNDSTTYDTLLKNESDQWYFKFGDGYGDIDMRSDGKKVVVRKLNKDNLFHNGSNSIYEVDLETKHSTKILDEGYFNPQYSNDGKSLYLIRYEQNRAEFLSENFRYYPYIYRYDIESKNLTKVTRGENVILFP